MVCVCVCKRAKNGHRYWYLQRKNQNKRDLCPSLYLYVTGILCQGAVEPCGLGFNFFRHDKQSLSALLNICNGTSLRFFSLSFYLLPLPTQWRSMAEMILTPAVIIASLDQYRCLCIQFLSIFQHAIYIKIQNCTGWMGAERSHYCTDQNLSEKLPYLTENAFLTFFKIYFYCWQ